MALPAPKIKATATEAGKQSGPEHWLSAHGDFLFRFALLRVKRASLAEDLVQDTLLSAIKAWNSFKGQASERSWLAEILKNKIIDYFRSAECRSTTPSDPAQLAEVVDGKFNLMGLWNVILPDWASQPERHFQNKQFFAALSSCLSKLPEASRRAFVLRTLDGVESDEICKILGLSSSNLWVSMHRTRMALRDCIERNWINAGIKSDS